MDEIAVSNLLERLGLTEYEAKTLSALFKAREAEAPEVSRIAQVPKTRVYDVLDRLVKKGLVIEIYGRPKKYRVVEADAAVEQLISKKKEEISALEEEAKKLKEFVSGIRSPGGGAEEKVMKVKEKHDFEKILAQELDKAKNNITAFALLDDEHLHMGNALKNASNRKVDVKVISRIPKQLKALMKEYTESGVSMKNFEHELNAFVIDNEKVVLGLSDFSKQKPEYHFTIWNKNPALSRAINLYFNEIWQKAK